MLIALVSLLSTNTLWKWIYGLGGPGLVLLGVADNTPFISAPAGSVDAMVVLLAAHKREWWAYYALMATIGEVAGGFLTYRLAQRGEEKTIEKKIGKKRAAQVYKWFAKSGFLAVFVGSMLPPPFPFTPVLMAAGVMHYPESRFVPCLVAGRAIRFLAMAYLGRIYGQRLIRVLSKYYRPALYLLIALAAVAGLIALIYFAWYRAGHPGNHHG